MRRVVDWSSTAKAQLRALDRQTALMILHAIDDFLKGAKVEVKQLSKPLSGYRLRVGDWRVLFEPLQKENAILVTKVAHRSVAYRQN